MDPLFLASVIASFLFLGVMGFSMVTWSVRTWQKIRGTDTELRDERILDALDQVQIQLSALNARLERIESGEESAGSPAHDPDSLGASEQRLLSD